MIAKTECHHLSELGLLWWSYFHFWFGFVGSLLKIIVPVFWPRKTSFQTYSNIYILSH